METGEVVFTAVRDEAIPQRDGSIERYRTYVFFVGKVGPFSERIPLAQFDPTEIGRRVELIRSHLSALPR